MREGRHKHGSARGSARHRHPHASARPHRCHPPGCGWETGCCLPVLWALFPPLPLRKIGTICSAGAGEARGGMGEPWEGLLGSLARTLPALP